MEKLLLVAAGGGAGAVVRYLLGLEAARRLGAGWPYGTFAVNVVGGLLMGLLMAFLSARVDGGERLRLLLGVGLLGGFTTFSAFSLEMALMIERRAYGAALGYAAASVAASVAALFAGLMMGRRLLA